MLYGYQRILVLKLTSVFTYAVYITLCSLTFLMQQILPMQFVSDYIGLSYLIITLFYGLYNHI